MEKLTESEKAAIYYHIFGGCKDRVILYTIAKGENAINRLKENSRKNTASLWFRSHNVQKFVEYVRITKDQEEQKKADLLRSEFENTNSTTAPQPAPVDGVNFLNLDEFLREANRQANETKDEKERRSWIEMIGKYMSFKDRSEGENTEIKRFYTPVECEKCIIYNKCRDCKCADCPEML